MNPRVLGEARAWWTMERRSPPWRAIVLQPRAPLVVMSPATPPYREPGQSAEEHRERLVDDVVRRRASFLHARAPTWNGGRLLASWGCNYSLWSGEAQAASNGFFDDLDLPPWDLWLGYEVPSGKQPYGGAALLAWVPDELVDLAQRGIDSAPGDCVAWLDGVSSSQDKYGGRRVTEGG